MPLFAISSCASIVSGALFWSILSLVVPLSLSLTLPPRLHLTLTRSCYAYAWRHSRGLPLCGIRTLLLTCRRLVWSTIPSFLALHVVSGCLQLLSMSSLHVLFTCLGRLLHSHALPVSVGLTHAWKLGLALIVPSPSGTWLLLILSYVVSLLCISTSFALHSFHVAYCLAFTVYPRCCHSC